jgi:hypothetical protein
MKKIHSIIFFFFISLNGFCVSNLYSQIDNTIIGKVGNSIITSIDLQNEIITNLVINKQEINQASINNSKNFAMKNLINKSIKRQEIEKFQIKNYNNKDLDDYIEKISKNFDTDSDGLREMFNNYNISYDSLVEKFEVELLWNTLIFTIYRNQTNVNIIDVENEIKKIKEDRSDEELKNIRQKILNRKKEEKLNLFSRSHFSNLENSMIISVR